jgi:hypothetical protein
MNVHAVLPTRGLIYAQTIKGIINNISTEHLTIIAGRPMPDCFNDAVHAGLDSGADYIWFIEEDNEIPDGVLQALLDLDADIATMHYRVGGGNSHIYKRGEEILWCGLGCTLFKRKVFEAIQEPWFECDKHLNFGSGTDMKIVNIPPETVGQKWGGHDSYFFYSKTRPKGFVIRQLAGWEGKHFRTKEIPKRELNNGYYTITSL